MRAPRRGRGRAARARAGGSGSGAGPEAGMAGRAAVAGAQRENRRRLCAALRGLGADTPGFGGAAAVYNPLEYAWEVYADYVGRFGGRRGVNLFLGMNPGPWGMAQTGVPFGLPRIVGPDGWLGCSGTVGRPEHEHPKRPILGFGCERDEVSGARVWGWAQERFKDPENFFRGNFIENYCPLVFMSETGSNVVPEKLKAADRRALLEACDASTKELLRTLQPRRAIGVGKWAHQRLLKCAAELEEEGGPHIECGMILHPSPASPAANRGGPRGWADQAEAQLRGMGVDLGD